jgi:hypothetical protein
MCRADMKQDCVKIAVMTDARQQDGECLSQLLSLDPVGILHFLFCSFAGQRCFFPAAIKRIRYWSPRGKPDILQ